MRLHARMLPCSVPIMNFVGPAWGEKSSETAPSTASPPLSFNCSDSSGSASLRMSHHSTKPSVDADMHSEPVFDCSQAMS